MKTEIDPNIVTAENAVSERWARQFESLIMSKLAPLAVSGKSTVTEKETLVDPARLTREDELAKLEAAVGGDFKTSDGRLLHVTHSTPEWQGFSANGGGAFILRFFVMEFVWAEGGKDGEPFRKSTREFFTDARDFIATHKRIPMGQDWSLTFRREACEDALKPAA
ncbi:MAG TPA: hypothetical protein VNZ64_12345 [Candidatus Acidoferrum sp.]|jgi:hypothetical protein|nr:hypothetical protein [Candidatus Acidoferrum sp.]